MNRYATERIGFAKVADIALHKGLVEFNQPDLLEIVAIDNRKMCENVETARRNFPRQRVGASGRHNQRTVRGWRAQIDCRKGN